MPCHLACWLLATACLTTLSFGQATLQVDLREPSADRYSRYQGAFGNGRFGIPVCGGHDCDGDGLVDSAFASINASVANRANAGIVTLVWGADSGFGETLDTLSLSDRTLRIGGAQTLEVCGSEIWMDDVDGDGVGDLIIGRQNFSPNATRRGAGALTILFGGPELRALAREGSMLDLAGPPASVQLLDIFGSSAYDRLGIWMRTGDVDGDGIADIVVGADEADAPRSINAGEVYVIRGGPHLHETTIVDLVDYPPAALGEHVTLITPPDRFPNGHFGATVQLGDLDGNGRAELVASAALDRAGAAVRLVGAPAGTGVGTGGIGRGSTFILWDSWFAPDQWVSGRVIAIDGVEPEISRITGGLRNAHLGEELLAGADFDGNGQPDLFLGDLRGQGPNGASAGTGYVFFDAATIRSRGFNVDEMPRDVRCTIIQGVSAGALSADAAAWGDLDGDRFDDLVITSPHENPSFRASAGSLHAIYGQATGWPAEIDLAANRLPDSVRIVHMIGALGGNGADAGDTLGYSIAVADMNTDGMDDIITNEMQGNGAQSLDVGNLVLYSGRALLPPTASPMLGLDQSFTMFWQSHLRLRYQIERSTQLVGWTPFGDPIDGTGGQINVPIQANNVPSSYYRLASQLID